MIRTPVKWLVYFLICFLLQSTVIPSISIMGIKPDLLLLVLFLFSTKTGALQGTYIGFLLGLAQDLYSPGILGQNALAKTLVGFFAGLFNERVMRIDPILQAVLLVVIFLLNDMVFMFVQVVKSSSSSSIVFSEMLTSSLPRALYSLLFASIPFLWSNFIKPASTRR